MSEYTPITQELRKLIDGQHVNASISKAAHHRAMEHCDAIDALHRNLEDENARLFAEVQRLTREREQAKASDEQYDRDTNWMKLPVDADGVSVHVGDLMMGYSDAGEPREVIAVTPTCVYLCDDGPMYAHLCRHYESTIESLLREYTEHLCELCTTEYACDTTREELMRQYADKLRYVGGE